MGPDMNWTCSNPNKPWIIDTKLRCPEDVDPACDSSECVIEVDPVYTLYYVLVLGIVVIFVLICIICFMIACAVTQCFFLIRTKSPSLGETMGMKREDHIT
jgi:hypothetical protein